MAKGGTADRAGWTVGVVAVVVGVLLFGPFADWFGPYGTEMAPGAAIPPNATSD